MSQSSKSRITVMLAALLGTVLSASAHDPMRSWASVRMTDEQVIVDVEMAGEAAMTLIGVPAGTQPIPEDAGALYGPMKTAMREGKLYQLLTDSKRLEPLDVSVEYDGDDAFKFRLRFARPKGAVAQLDAAFLAGLPDEHRTILMVLQPDGTPLGASVPTKRERIVDFELPAPVPAG